MLRVILVRPGSTEFDEQGRIKGNLDIPLSPSGSTEVARTAAELASISIDAVYSSPCSAAVITAEAIADPRDLRVKRLDKLHNLDRGLWHGKLIEEVRRSQPKAYRQWQEHPETVCPPQGEEFGVAEQRVREVLEKLRRKHKDGAIAIVSPEPLASLLAHELLNDEVGNADFGDLWKVECQCGKWEVIDCGVAAESAQ
jgi:broad specificity phosphatase PhoE